MKKSVAKKVVKEKGEYTAEIKVLGQFYKATGETILEAITNIKLAKGRGVSVLSVSKGEVKQERIFNNFFTNRLFSPAAMMREVALKQASERFSV